MNNIKKYIPYFYLTAIYILVFFQYPASIRVGSFLFHSNIAADIQPSYLLIWGLMRILIVMPMIFALLIHLNKKPGSIFLNFGDKNRMISLTFWVTSLFVLLGILFYPYFLVESSLTVTRLMYLIPFFSLFAISNAFVEETFFRGASLTILSEKFGFWLGNIVQALFFGLIHIINPMSSNLLLFVFLTFALGLVWGWVTKYTKSLIPAIVCHIVADIFVAISLF